jgi:hypothetical protein
MSGQIPYSQYPNVNMINIKKLDSDKTNPTTSDSAHTPDTPGLWHQQTEFPKPSETAKTGGKTKHSDRQHKFEHQYERATKVAAKAII